MQDNRCKNCKFYSPFPSTAFEEWGIDAPRYGRCRFINHIDKRYIYDEDDNIVGTGLSDKPEVNSINIVDGDPTYYVLVGENFGCVNFVKRED